ncbi:hypothetical protein [Sulfitobacter sp.]|uniref:hypothetical protein n=1 Tax=Sulfitobacter sp. TaxID=1903071 RepID=UPI003001F600
MINNNKILTVSYGTFSCTLEGFDDSFGTMKAIAEYFRDLAADDRYFGAEPPQPDAQMLARIAQREISRHVEAREDEGRIVLSAKDTAQTASLVASDVVDDVATAVADATVAKAKIEDSTPAAETHEANAVVADDMQDDAIKDADDAYDEVNEFSIEDEDDVEDTADVSDETSEEAEDTPAETIAKVDEPDIVPSLPNAEVEAFFAERAEEQDSVEEFDEAVDEPTQERARADSIADKLKRIRAVVSQQTDAQTAPDYSEDQHADAQTLNAAMAEMPSAEDFADDEDSADVSNDMLADTLRDLEDALDADDEMDEVQETAEDASFDDTENQDDDITAILSRLDSEADSAELTVGEAEPNADAYDDDEMDGNILAAMDTVEAVDDVEEDNLFDAEEPAPQAEAPKPAAPRARVLKVKRATLEAAIKAGKLEEYEDEDEDEDDAPVQAASEPLRKAPLADSSSLSDEAEEELARELAELEAEMAADHDQDFSDEVEDAELDDFEDELEELAEEEAPAPRAEIRRSADADLSRLMEETKQQMQEPESATRRDAFSHLRAAVAAKKADEAVGGSLDETETDEAYRDDLASVVRPRRPVSGEGTRTERPSEQRPAPLKLVAEQRIDVSEVRKVAPVRPRRVAAVATGPVVETADATSFTDFASEMGAESLPDLLEAAAAYLSFVEGHEQFSRPQLMIKVRQVEQDNFTREDSLRSFGKLLREGKIEKLKGGQFQASEQIGFKPDARAAG